MKALTICQPYAEMIARGDKRVENRTWFTSHRGPLYIHAGKSREWLDGDTDDELAEEFGRQIEFGAIVATCRLVDCLHIDKIEAGQYDARFPWLRTHEHTNGEWCWVLDEIQRLPQPIVINGKQGLWEYN